MRPPTRFCARVWAARATSSSTWVSWRRAAVGETPDACRADLESAPDDVQALFADRAPRLALVDDAVSPTAWRFVEEFYRVRDTTVGYEVG